jgi:carboxymethylenebutenolidase
MIEHHIDIPTVDGAMNSFVVYPDEGGPFPVVLFYMDAPGKREELHEMARRIAAVGYCVVLPNLYYRRTRDFWLRERTEENLKVMFGLMETLDRASTLCDTRAMLDYVDQLPAANARHVGALGYCMRGPFVVWAATAFPDRLACITSIHAARMVTQQPDSPHLLVPQLRCDSYFGCAENDSWASKPDMVLLEAGLRQSAAPWRLEWYADTEHGFVFPGRTIYKKAAAERHWARAFSQWRRCLQRPAEAGA